MTETHNVLLRSDFLHSAAISVVLNTSATSGADLGLTLSTIPVMVTGDLNFTATVYNGGPQDSSGVVLTENLPSGLKFVSAQPSQGTCSGTTTITCDLGTMPELSTATVQFSVTPSAAGTFTNNLKVAGAQRDLNSGNNSVSFTVTAVVPDFSLSPSSASLTMKRGGEASENLTIGTQGGFSGLIALACSVSGPAPMPTCGISPSSVTPGNNTTLTVNGAAIAAELRPPSSIKWAHGLWVPCLLLVALVLVFALTIDRQRRTRWAFWLVVLAASILPAACGGGGSSTKGPQNFTVTVTATSGAIQHATNIAVTVD